MSDVNPEMGFVLNCDVLIVGGGFSGIASLYRARKLGLNAKLFEAGADFGGVWHWNRYPGARVDSEFPFYQLNIPEAYRSWHFSERFPGAEELRRYMAHLDKALDLSKDTLFQARVVDAQYDTLESKWKVKTSAGHTATCKYLILATGLLHRTYSPDFLGLEDYKGAVHHSGSWPENLSCRGKKVAVIGAGATAVQIVQELAKETASSGGSLTVFIRRPSTCIPMRQRPISKEEQDAWKAYFARLFQEGRKSRAGFPFKLPGKGVYDVSDEEREAYLEEIWGRGAFNFAMANYNNVATNLAANRAVYDFWAKKTRARITDPLKRDIMAPLEPLYPIGTKRSPLEQDYYECLDMKHVEIVNMNSTPLKTFTDKGMLLDGQTEREFDVIVLATGFDSFTGS
jgi:cation diffusion facilitator CzcD-associated flavoprotein CzcO